MTVETLIIGAGISGLSTAWQLAQAGCSVAVWESGARLGGKIATDYDPVSGYTTEQAASMVLNFRPEVSRFLQETGLESCKLIRSPTTKRYLIHQGQLREVPMTLSGLLLTPLWSWPAKLRLLLEPFIMQQGHANETVAEFVRRRLGSEILDKALGAYISGTLASDPEQASAQAILPRLTALEQRYGSLTAGVFAHKVLNKKQASETEGFSFQGGMSALIEKLAVGIASKIHLQHKLVAVSPEHNGWSVVAQTPTGEKSLWVRNLILTTPAPATAQLLKYFDKPLSELLTGIQYAPLSVVHLGVKKDNIKHAVSGTGFLTPPKEKTVINGSMWMHSLFQNRAPTDHVLLSNYLGGARHPEVINWDTQQCIDSVTQELQDLLGLSGHAAWAKVDQHAQALPLYHGHYMQRQQQIQQCLRQHTGLYLQGNYIGGVSIRDRIIQAEKLAQVILSKTASHSAQTATHHETTIPINR